MKKYFSPITLIIIFLILIDVAIIMAHFLLAQKIGFFDLDKEQNLKAVFSGFQLLLCGFGSLFLFMLFKKAGGPLIVKIIWALQAIMFFYLAMDDMMMLHERVGFVINHWANMRGACESFNWIIYFSPFIISGSILIILAVRSLFILERRAGWLSIIGSLGLFSSIFLEIAGGQILKMGFIPVYKIFIAAEEAALLAGESFFLAAIFSAIMSAFPKIYAFKQNSIIISACFTPLFFGKLLKPILIFASHWLKIILLFLLSSVVFFAISAFFIPALSMLEKYKDISLPFEAVIRFSIIIVYSIFLIGSSAWVARRGNLRHQILWGLLSLSFISLIIIFAGDTNHRIMEEYFWIRYTTSGFLIAAAFASFLCARDSLKDKLNILAGCWMFIGVGLIFGAADEVFQIHETLGNIIEKNAFLPHATTDLITLAYALISLAVLIIFTVLFFNNYREKLFSLGLFFAGGFVYLLSTLLDTFDVYALPFLKNSAEKISQNQNFIFNDYLTLIWSPRNFLNSIEEVLEQTAAVLFFSAGIIIFIDRRREDKQFKVPNILTRLIRPFIAIIFIIYFSFLIFGLSQSNIKNPVFDNLTVARIADYKNDLNHADDLDYNKKWGLIIGNEGSGSVLQWKDGNIKKIPDPEKMLADTDSVAVSQDAIYVSSGSKGTIFKYSEKKGWQAIWTKKDGLNKPEALVYAGEAVYAIDESEKTLTKLEEGKKAIVWHPEHKDWQSPEGIVYLPKKKIFIITDDVSGAVFQINFGKSIEKISQLKHPEDIAIGGDGNLLITDNGDGAVHKLNPDGFQIKKLQFYRAYRDLQGVATDGKNIFVLTSDGYGSGSFMPGFIFSINGWN